MPDISAKWKIKNNIRLIKNGMQGKTFKMYIFLILKNDYAKTVALSLKWILRGC